jgi:hypothetical protein
MPNDNPVLTISHITHGELVFQVLNEEGNDWDEAATRASYEEFLNAQGGA